MKVLFVLSNSETAFWLSELTHPYWHLTERGVEVDLSSPNGGKVVWDPYSDPYFKNSTEPDDLVSKGFLSDKTLVAKLDTTLRLRDVNLDIYDAVHVAAAAARLSTFIRTTTLHARSSISGRATKSSARFVTAQLRWAIFPIGFEAAE